MAAEVRDSEVEVPGGRLFVRQWPGAQGALAPIVLLHDSLGSVELWRDFPPALAEATGRDVVAYDRLGFGKSTPRVGRPSIRFVDEEAGQVGALCRALDLPRFVLFGHSVGGAMAVAIAAMHGDGCEAVVAVSAQAFVEARTIEGIRTAEAAFRDPAQVAKLAKWHGERAPWVLDAWIGVWTSPEFESWSLDGHLPKVTCPLLAIHGDSDEYGSDAFPRRIAGLAGGTSKLAILEGCGHVPHREKREEVLRLVAAFLG